MCLKAVTRTIRNKRHLQRGACAVVNRQGLNVLRLLEGGHQHRLVLVATCIFEVA